MKLTINTLSSSIFLALSIGRALANDPVFRKGSRMFAVYCREINTHPVPYGVQLLTGKFYYPNYSPIPENNPIPGVFTINEDYLAVCCIRRAPPRQLMDLSTCKAANRIPGA
ncbi:hypothetical protein PGTUg99_011915 [Puccinia graminis f. sp. tritici]|uniref:Uncharacterized protein n=1 Tax=Puccinia graminis f. sp. tritici TaxID=56615 RepID=A0A5B0RN73_PUCGR|nr:hypothetical protein PGTUg99_011915 [Puccinia graminis f. sp. tritici]